MNKQNIILRPYQETAISAVDKDFCEFDRLLLVLATGLGKTIIFNKMAINYSKKNKRVLILAHRGELLNQAYEKLRKIEDSVECDFEWAKHNAHDTDKNIVIASVQSLSRRNRLEKYDKGFFDYIIIDEAHHALAETYRRILNYFNAKVIGVTATPSRGDKQELSDYFDKVSYEYNIRDGIIDKFLSRIKICCVPIKFNLNKVKISTGDFNPEQLDNVILSQLMKVVKSIKKYAKDRKTLIFMPRVGSSKTLVRVLNKEGINACHIDGKSPDRKEILNDFSKGKYQVLCNSSLLLEGYDEPSIDCIINLRATKIQTLYSQIVGRGTRLYDNKKNLLVLEFDWNSDRHKVANVFNLIEEDDVLSEVAMEFCSGSAGEEFDVLDIVEKAKEDIGAMIFGKMIKHVKKQLYRKDKLIDYKAYAFLCGNYHIMTYQPMFRWHRYDITYKQRACLKKMGIDPKGINMGLASIILDTLFNNGDNSRKCTVRQIALIAKQYLKSSMGIIAMDEASAIIDEMAENRWQLKQSAKDFIDKRIHEHRKEIYTFSKKNVSSFDF